GYKHASCISVNDELVHGVPSEKKMLKSGDIVKIDICASWHGYCAYMARVFVIEQTTLKVGRFLSTCQESLDVGIREAVVGARVSDISAAIQKVIEGHGYSVIRDFAGHGIG